MPCCGSCCDKDEDGILSGKSSPIDSNFQKPLSLIFQNQLKANKIHGSKNAIEFADNVLTFYQLEEFSTSLALDIQDRIGLDFKITNPDSDPVIAICIPSSEKAICLIFAILKTGAAYLPLDPQYPEQLLLDILDSFRPVFLITDENSLIYNKYDVNKFSDKCKLITIEELWLAMEIPIFTNERKRKNSVTPLILDIFKRTDDPLTPPEKFPAVIFHTRGLTGNPTGVRVCHLSIINRCCFDWSYLKLEMEDSCSLGVPLSLPDSCAQLFIPLLRGCTLHVFRRVDLKDMSEFIRTVANKFINRLSIPNHHFRDFLFAIDISGRQESVKSLSSLKHVISRGGFLHLSDVIQFFEIFHHVTLYNCNGPAETTGEVVYEKFNSTKEFKSKRVQGRLTLGRLIDNVKIYIVGDHLGIISDGNQGEISVAGLCLALGYVNEKALREHKIFVKNPHEEDPEYETLFRSGEFGRIVVTRHGKRLYVEGRDDKIIMRSGHTFSTEDVQTFLKDLSFAKDAFVFIYHKGKPTQELIGFIIPKDGASVLNMPDPIEIDFTLREKLPEWALPDEVMFVEALPQHYSQKMCTYCLLQQFREKREPKFTAWETLKFPLEKMETAITLIKGIYKFTSIPVEDIIFNIKKSFFEMGGNSSNAMTLLVFLNKRGFPVSLKDFYSTPKLSDFIDVMRAKQLAQTNLDRPSTDNLAVKPNFHIMLEIKDAYSITLMRKKHKSSSINLIAAAYCEKGELQSCNMVSSDDFHSFLNQVWATYEDEGICLIVTRKSDDLIIGVAICQDFFTVVDTTKANGALFHVLEFCHEIKGNMLQFVPHRTGETLEIAWMATHLNLRPDENIKIITMLHTEIIKLAKISGYSGILNPTTNILSRTLCIEVFGYMLLEDFPANKYKELDGSRPFHLAGDLVVAAGLLLSLKEPDPPSEASSTFAVDPVAVFEKFLKKGAGGLSFLTKPNS